MTVGAVTLVFHRNLKYILHSLIRGTAFAVLTVALNALTFNFYQFNINTNARIARFESTVTIPPGTKSNANTTGTVYFFSALGNCHSDWSDFVQNVFTKQFASPEQ
ncbi:hypothetical protein BJ878DRAFT_543286 [Calycina marina]|uniref:Uncharacterized protein n=1 Tax=Calycina marina TaxID=1763456 RepID=A0A9P8CDV2_9HELO|nr:hypothetical protein BJ878DRAFT_543286 [Calycina marina]